MRLGKGTIWVMLGVTIGVRLGKVWGYIRVRVSLLLYKGEVRGLELGYV